MNETTIKCIDDFIKNTKYICQVFLIKDTYELFEKCNYSVESRTFEIVKKVVSPDID